MIGIRPLFAGLLLFSAGLLHSNAKPQGQAPDFKEVYDLIRAHLTGVSEEDLNRAAVEALVTALAPKVSLAGAEGTTVGGAGAPPVSKSSLLDDGIVYVRISRVEAGLR